MSRYIKMILVAVSSLLVMIQFQNCSKIQMSNTDLTQSKLDQASTDGGGNDQLGAPVENEPPVELVDCPEVLVNGSVEYIPVQTIEELVASQPVENRTDYLNDLLNSCKAKGGSASGSNGSSGSSADSDAAKCVKVCHALPDSPQKIPDSSSSDDCSSDDNSSDDNSSDDKD